MVFTALHQGIKTLFRPHKTYEDLDNISLELMVKQYLQLIITMGIIAGVMTLIWNIGRAMYYDLFQNIIVNYPRMLNYLTGKVFGVAFGYLMIGTFGIFIISLLLNIIMRKTKYTKIFKILFVSTTPIILLGWIPKAIIGVSIWSLLLFIQGYKDAGKAKKIHKKSLEQRD